MPTATVSHNNGSTPVITGNLSRTELVLQNNSARNIRVRFHGEVSASDPTKRGLLLRKDGGTMVRTGPAAQKAVYAIHNEGVGLTADLDFETDVLPT